MHCSPRQQNMLARSFVEHLEDALLLYAEFAESGKSAMIQPAELKCRVLLKGKVKNVKHAATLAPKGSLKGAILKRATSGVGASVTAASSSWAAIGARAPSLDRIASPGAGRRCSIQSTSSAFAGRRDSVQSIGGALTGRRCSVQSLGGGIAGLLDTSAPEVGSSGSPGSPKQKKNGRIASELVHTLCQSTKDVNRINARPENVDRFNARPENVNPLDARLGPTGDRSFGTARTLVDCCAHRAAKQRLERARRPETQATRPEMLSAERREEVLVNRSETLCRRCSWRDSGPARPRTIADSTHNRTCPTWASVGSREELVTQNVD
mmetsp:Transcript_34887/g.96347  ORF Transcript_34887/g.96347 Transcript_34887/m.96347 type:complete len:324 (-) Transcript_34887:2300-3271(-)